MYFFGILKTAFLPVFYIIDGEIYNALPSNGFIVRHFLAWGQVMIALRPPVSSYHWLWDIQSM